MAHLIGNGRFTNKKNPNVGEYTSPMDGMGYIYTYIAYIYI